MMAGLPACIAAIAKAGVGTAPQSTGASPESATACAHWAAMSGLDERRSRPISTSPGPAAAVFAQHGAEGADMGVARQAHELRDEAAQAGGSEFEAGHVCTFAERRKECSALFLRSRAGSVSKDDPGGS